MLTESGDVSQFTKGVTFWNKAPKSCILTEENLKKCVLKAYIKPEQWYTGASAMELAVLIIHMPFISHTQCI